MTAPRDARPIVMDWRIQIFFFGHTGCTGVGSSWGTGSGPCAGSYPNFGSSSEASSDALSTAAPAGAVCLEGNNELHIHHCELRCYPHNSGRELCDGGAVTRRGRCQVCNGIDRLLLEVTVVRVCGGVVRGAVGGTHIVLNQEAPLPVGGSEENI